jgi:uncharacterized protein (DUF1330 family)
MPVGPTKNQITALAESPLAGPVVMLNLLRFAERASGEHDAKLSGRESYARYGERMRTMLEETGARVLWQGRVDSVVIGDDDADGWDAVILVEYPSRQAFLEMTSSPGYREVSKDRSAALTDSRLFATTEMYRLGGT